MTSSAINSLVYGVCCLGPGVAAICSVGVVWHCICCPIVCMLVIGVAIPSGDGQPCLSQTTNASHHLVLHLDMEPGVALVEVVLQHI